MTVNESPLRQWNPGWPFYFGLALVPLAVWIPFVPGWQTFIHMWRADLAAALFLVITLGFIAIRSKRISLALSFSVDEFRFILLPIAVFICWSGLSVFWADSWKSAFHHTAVWLSYLGFYLLFRYLLDRPSNLSGLVRIFTVVLLLFAIPAIIEFAPLAAFGGDGELWLRVRYAKNGEQIVTLLPLLLVLVLRLSGRAFYAGVGSVVLLWLLIYCTASRVNLILFGSLVLALSAIVFAFSRYHHFRKKLCICVLFITAAPMPLYLISMSSGETESPIAKRLMDSEGNAYSNDFRLLMNTISLEMMASDPLFGVGGDNYGLQFNRFRARYSSGMPNDPRLAYGEAGTVGHAHNEFLQIAAELGIVGAGIFLWLLIGIVLMGIRAIRSLNHRPLVGIAAVLGLGAFLASSLVTSYSFRLVQNGLIFFFVLAVAAKVLFKHSADDTEKAFIPSASYLKPAWAIGMLVCLGFVIHTAARVGSVAITSRANDVNRLDDARPLYKAAMDLDDENPDVRQNLGMRLLRRGRYAEAVPFLESAVRIGRATSTDFSYLASAKSLAGDNVGAEATMAEAAALFPRSPFVLARYSELLASNGKRAESVLVFARATAIDRRAATTWRAVITIGPKAVSDLVARNDDYIPVMQLNPTNAIYAVVTERYIKHPDEQRFSMLKITFTDD